MQRLVLGVRQCTHSPHWGENSVTTRSPGATERHALADRLDGAAALVAEHARRVAGRVGAGRRVEVGVADAAGEQAHEHLAGTGPGELDVLHGQGRPELLEDRSTNSHGRSLCCGAMGALEDLGRDGDARQEQIVSVLVDAFEDLIEADPKAFRRKFRKMAADPFAFYRGSACLFYADVAELEDRWADERTSRVWIQGDLHAENYGTYMDAAGILVFDVNDFDEAYLGHFTWDLQRMAASLALLGFAKALSDETIREMIAHLRAAPTSSRCARSTPATRTTSSGSRSRTPTARCTTCCSRRGWRRGIEHARVDDRDRGPRARSSPRGPACAGSTTTRRPRCARPTRRTSTRSPRSSASTASPTRSRTSSAAPGFGIGSAGLPAYNLLIEGRTPGARERRRALDEAGQHRRARAAS